VATKNTSPSEAQESAIAIQYEYRDENGQSLFEVVRYEPKAFKMRSPNGFGNWTWNMNGVRKVLYRLPEVLAAVQSNETVYVVEGEKDADRLASLGMCATTNPGGACRWRDEYSEALAQASVVILPDNDEAGCRHAEKVARSLNGKAASIRIVELPGLPKKGDVSDWLDAGHTVEELAMHSGKTPELAADTPETTTSPPANAVQSFHLTDLGNAKRLVSRHGRDIRYCPEMQTWFYWDGRRWCRDNVSEVERRAQETAEAIWNEARDCADESARPNVFKWAHTSESAARKNAMLEQARSRSEIVVRIEDFDRQLILLNAQNGTLNLQTGKLHGHNREDLITRIAFCDYFPDAICEAWNDFLQEVTDGRQEIVEYLQCAVGCTLLGRNLEERFFFVHGPSATGKSTFMEAIKASLGDYAATVDFGVFLKRDPGAARGELVNAQGARFLLSSETDGSYGIANSVLKSVTGGDTFSARLLYREAVQFRPTYTPWLVSNDAPAFQANDEATWRRVVRIPFDHVVPAKNRNPKLKETFRKDPAALQAILTWCIDGVKRYLERGLNAPDHIEKAAARLRDELDPVSGFIDECCVFAEGKQESSACLYQAYLQWAERNAQNRVSQRSFGMSLKRRGLEQGQRSATTRRWKGIGFRKQNELCRSDSSRDA